MTIQEEVTVSQYPLENKIYKLEISSTNGWRYVMEDSVHNKTDCELTLYMNEELISKSSTNDIDFRVNYYIENNYQEHHLFQMTKQEAKELCHRMKSSSFRYLSLNDFLGLEKISSMKIDNLYHDFYKHDYLKMTMETCESHYITNNLKDFICEYSTSQKVKLSTNMKGNITMFEIFKSGSEDIYFFASHNNDENISTFYIENEIVIKMDTKKEDHEKLKNQYIVNWLFNNPTNSFKKLINNFDLNNMMSFEEIETLTTMIRI